mmetsp:Transcript_30895/g.60307  ORF Transcript_30895/g.60307 Transcript_30895/m.60307 type:complete len:429 (+) Transcript_30895:83-1369(+)|eukprot:CAMPEP_0175163876 /NCGR_PEP_ID=MMETSP0087-20121206/26039_1 /TAXON_ID=136419 /ORGANISM="Unknown Unknown, Strain D1" /LENGTH=428 /DNA_ID=CAMNT_0016452721 /DNA_START=59 /DNA_END=1345 /DNA_ORIENTATION=-
MCSRAACIRLFSLSGASKDKSRSKAIKKEICMAPACNKIATKTCPLCKAQGGSFQVCSQQCLDNVWEQHKTVHQQPGLSHLSPNTTNHTSHPRNQTKSSVRSRTGTTNFSDKEKQQLARAEAERRARERAIRVVVTNEMRRAFTAEQITLIAGLLGLNVGKPSSPSPHKQPNQAQTSVPFHTSTNDESTTPALTSAPEGATFSSTHSYTGYMPTHNTEGFISKSQADHPYSPQLGHSSPNPAFNPTTSQWQQQQSQQQQLQLHHHQQQQQLHEQHQQQQQQLQQQHQTQQQRLFSQFPAPSPHNSPFQPISPAASHLPPTLTTSAAPPPHLIQTNPQSTQQIEGRPPPPAYSHSHLPPPHSVLFQQLPSVQSPSNYSSQTSDAPTGWGSPVGPHASPRSATGSQNSKKKPVRHYSSSKECPPLTPVTE